MLPRGTSLYTAATSPWPLRGYLGALSAPISLWLLLSCWPRSGWVLIPSLTSESACRRLRMLEFVSTRERLTCRESHLSDGPVRADSPCCLFRWGGGGLKGKRTGGRETRVPQPRTRPHRKRFTLRTHQEFTSLGQPSGHCPLVHAT